MGTDTLDDVDRGLAHALQVDGRASFRAIGDVLGVSEQTVARRYRRLRSAGAIRVVGAIAGPRLGQVSWTVRLRCTPDAGEPIATALARRPDTFWVALLSAGTEISCNIQTRETPHGDDHVLEKLPRTTRVLAVSAHSVLRTFATPATWTGMAVLTDEQVEVLRPPRPRRDTEPITLEGADHALLDVLARDGRAGYPELAAATGWSESTVRRRIARMRGAGALNVLLDIAPRTLGFRAEARLWLSVRPSRLVSVAEELGRHSEVSFAAIATGPSNLMATIACRDTEDMYRYLTERIGALDAVHTAETAPVIRTVKRAGTVPPFGPGRRSTSQGQPPPGRTP